MPTFIPNRDFGRYALERAGAYLTVQLLDVPTTVSGDRHQWTWANNWKNYVVTGAYSGTGGSLTLYTGNVSDKTPSLTNSATTPFAGAYYAGTKSTIYARVYNSTAFQYTFSHAAFFMRLIPETTFNVNQSDLDTYLVGVVPYNTNEVSTGLNSNKSLYYYFSADDYYGSLNVTVAKSFEDWVDQDKLLTEDFFGSGSYTGLLPSLSSANPDLYFSNKNTSAFMLDTYKNTLGISSLDPVATFLVEMLNVTGTEPGISSGWSGGWSPYRTKQYTTATVPTTYTYTDKSDSYSVDFLGDTYTFTWEATQIGFSEPVEFVVNPPASGSYTYTHLAVFANEVDTPPAAGTTYTYINNDALIGVIKVGSTVTMTTTSTPISYPFDFTFTLNASSDLA